MPEFTPPKIAKSFRCRRLHVVFGDQLDAEYPSLLALDPARDCVLMMEVARESSHVPSHVQRTVLFLAAMRHFAMKLAERGLPVRYVTLDDPASTHGFAGEIARAVEALRPDGLDFIHPGEWRVLKMVEAIAEQPGMPAVTVHDDSHFLTRREAFAAWASGRKQLTMEFFYREQRRRLNVLMEADGKTPVGGQWNFDKENRASFDSKPRVPEPYTPRVDGITREVIELVRSRLPRNPGAVSESTFRWPVTRETALRALSDFVSKRLASFGEYEDAMWTGERYLYHSLLSSSLNLKLLRPMECVEAAVSAYERGRAPLNAVEGFVRQIIGWREFIRGVYWQQGVDYPSRNGLDQHGKLPAFYWDASSDMACMRDCLTSTRESAFNHHIPRLMVIGNFAMIAGVHPREVADWFLAMYVDAVDWASNPNTIGMSQHADHGVVGTKPYAGSGKYIERMSNYCKGCAYDVGARTLRGAKAGSVDDLFSGRTGRPPCPFNVFYWDFLIRHRETFAGNQRLAMILKNVDRMSGEERVAITVSANAYRDRFGIGPVQR